MIISQFNLKIGGYWGLLCPLNESSSWKLDYSSGIEPTTFWLQTGALTSEPCPPIYLKIISLGFIDSTYDVGLNLIPVGKWRHRQDEQSKGQVQWLDLCGNL